MQTFSLFFKIMHLFKDFVEIITKLWSDMHPFQESKTRINTEHSNEREWTYNNFALQQLNGHTNRNQDQKTSNVDHQQVFTSTAALNFSPWEFPIKVFLDIRRALFLLQQPVL